MFIDALIMDKTWEAPGGFLGFSARFARTGIQMYDGSEIDPTGTHKLADGTPKFQRGTLYAVDRPAEEVFSAKSLASFIAKPLTNDHPAEGVTIDNWNAKTKGVIGEVLRDGEYARLSGLMTDKGLISDYRAGKKELSGGYEANLVIGDGVNSAGQAFVAKQTMIDGNHVAFVDRGRAGSECAVIDSVAHCDAAPQSFLDAFNKEKSVSNFMLDGLTVNLGDATVAAATVQTLRDQRDEARGKVTAADAKVVAAEATIVAKDADIAKLTADLAAAKLTPAQMRDAGKTYAMVAGKAKKLGITVTDAMDEGAIKRAVVDKQMGDKAKDYSDEHVSIAFDSLTAGMKVDDAAADQFAAFVRDGVQHTDGMDIEGDRAKRRASVSDAWRQPAAANA